MRKNLFSAILRYSSFASLIVAIIAILLKFNINLQINYFQFCLFLIVFSNLINIAREKSIIKHPLLYLAYFTCIIYAILIATVYKGNIIKNLIMDCQSYTKYRPNETTGGIFVSWRRKEELPTGA